MDSYWIGVDDTKIEGTFVYGDNLPIIWNKWNIEEPNGDRNENCVEFQGDNGNWNDASCFIKNPSICEISNPMIDCRIYAIRALNFLTKNHNLHEFGYKYYGNNFNVADDYDLLESVLSNLSDVQEKNEEFINSLVGGACRNNKEKQNCTDYCANMAPELNLNLRWIFSIGIEVQANVLKQKLGQIEGRNSIILSRFKEILYNYEETIYGSDILYKNCLEFLCLN